MPRLGRDANAALTCVIVGTAGRTPKDNVPYLSDLDSRHQDVITLAADEISSPARLASNEQKASVLATRDKYGASSFFRRGDDFQTDRCAADLRHRCPFYAGNLL
jgi:hypothetical protein